MKPALLLAAVSTLLFLFPPNSVFAKNADVGRYAIVDHVQFERNDSSPSLIRRTGDAF
jgi:hypothetical protein